MSYLKRVEIQREHNRRVEERRKARKERASLSGAQGHAGFHRATPGLQHAVILHKTPGAKRAKCGKWMFPFGYKCGLPRGHGVGEVRPKCMRWEKVSRSEFDATISAMKEYEANHTGDV